MHAYEEIRSEMLSRIADHRWTPGYLLPHEQELAREFGVARGTIRRAMSDLVDQGLLERKRKAGTRVAQRTSHSSTLTIPIVRKEVTGKGAQYGYKLLEIKSGEDVNDSTNHFRGAQLIQIRCLHFADGQPYQLEDRLISTDAVPEARDQDFSEVSPNEWLVEQVPYSAVRTLLRTEPADVLQARHLKIRQGTPVFVIERQTRLECVPITFVKMSHPAVSFSIATETGATV